MYYIRGQRRALCVMRAPCLSVCLSAVESALKLLRGAGSLSFTARPPPTRLQLPAYANPSMCVSVHVRRALRWWVATPVSVLARSAPLPRDLPLSGGADALQIFYSTSLLRRRDPEGRSARSRRLRRRLRQGSICSADHMTCALALVARRSEDRAKHMQLGRLLTTLRRPAAPPACLILKTAAAQINSGNYTTRCKEGRPGHASWERRQAPSRTTQNSPVKEDSSQTPPCICSRRRY